MLFRIWEGPSARQTQDLDLLGAGDPDAMEAIAREVVTAVVEPDDGLRFEPESVRVEPIRDAAEYRGVRARLGATLDSARILVQIDVGFGDAITPDPQEVQYPVLLDLPAPRIRVYPRETVVAEKFQAIVSLGTTNTRVKDYYDLWHLAREYAFNGATLARAVRRTFERRATGLPAEPPLGLTATYLANGDRSRQWAALASRIHTNASVSLADAGTAIADFLLPVTRENFGGTWSPGGPWKGTEND